MERETENDPVVTASLNSKKRGAKDDPTITPNLSAKKFKSRTYAMNSTSSNTPAAVHDAYRVLMANNAEGVAFLHGARLHDTLEEVASQVVVRYRATKEDSIEEFRRLIAIKVYMVDGTAEKISPTPLMDEIWHAAILDTQLYGDLQRALGMTLHHRPQGAATEEDQQREVRLRVMEAIYHIFFMFPPLRVFSNFRSKARPYSSAQVPQDPISVAIQSTQDPISVTVKSLDGNVWQVAVGREDSVERLKGIIQQKGQFPVDQQKMLFVGRELENSQTIKDYGITQGSVVYLVLRLSGC